ncbi:unnamed protein product, partial [Polarella glacialis]
VFGICGPALAAITFVEGDCPNSKAWQFCSYLVALSGVVRASAGFFPQERGLWLACIGSMLLEVVWTTHVGGITEPANLLCGITALYMMMNVPAGLGKRAA